MALKIRLSRGGAKKKPFYRIVVAEATSPRDGKFVEKIGSYNPLLPKEKKDRIKLEQERVKHWLSKGAKPTSRVSRILGELNIIPKPKPGNSSMLRANICLSFQSLVEPNQFEATSPSKG